MRAESRHGWLMVSEASGECWALTPGDVPHAGVYVDYRLPFLKRQAIFHVNLGVRC